MISQEQIKLFINNDCKNFCINISDYNNFLKMDFAAARELKYEPITLLDILKKGLYAVIGEDTHIWVANHVPIDHFKFVTAPPPSNKEEFWSVNLSLDNIQDIGRYSKLKAFW